VVQATQSKMVQWFKAHYWIKFCSFICLLSFQKENKVSAKLEFTPSQYHVQTDDGNQRFFKYQTWSGQYRKETRLDDGSVVGSYGWIDANGILRMYEYIADNKGYRVTKDRAFQVEDNATKEEIDNLIESKEPSKETLRSTKSLPQDDTTSFDAEEIQQRKLVKKKKKAKFELPNPNLVKSLLPRATSSSNSKRLQRRISADFVPIFDDNLSNFDHLNTNQLTPQTKTKVKQQKFIKSLPRISSLPRSRKARIQPQREDYRTHYRPGRKARQKVPLTRRKFSASGPQGGRFYVVKRKRRPNSLSNNRRHEEANNLEVEAATASINYQTDKAFHHEAVLDNGERHGEYGYIDPIGIRRVVTYTTGPAAQPSSGIIKAKENDYVGPNTYFEAS